MGLWIKGCYWGKLLSKFKCRSEWPFRAGEITQAIQEAGILLMVSVPRCKAEVITISAPCAKGSTLLKQTFHITSIFLSHTRLCFKWGRNLTEPNIKSYRKRGQDGGGPLLNTRSFWNSWLVITPCFQNQSSYLGMFCTMLFFLWTV